MVGSLKRPRLIIFAIVALALLLRTYHLGTIPNGFHVDEMNAGYVGRYILVHGADIYGNPWPLFFNKLGDFRPTGIFYLSGLSTIFFGTTEAAVRFPSALLGALTVVALFLLTRELFGDTTSALLSSLFLAVLPWHFVLSRATSEAIIGLFFVCFGVWKLLSGLRTNTPSSVGTAALLLFASYFFYHAFRFLVPLLLIPCLWYPKRERRVAKSIVGITALFEVLTLAIRVAPWGGSRFAQVAFYKNPTLPNTIASLIFTDGTNTVATARMFHNKPIIYTREFMKQYSGYLSPDFLFLTGGLPDRYTTPEQGLLYVVFTPFLLLGPRGA